MLRTWSQAMVVVILAGLLVTAGLATTVGYVEQRDYTVALAGPTSIKCDKKATISATVRRAKNGKPVANQAVHWSIFTRQSPNDRLTSNQTTTNRQGVAVTKLKFGSKGGKRVVQARIPGAKPKITVRCLLGSN